MRYLAMIFTDDHGESATEEERRAVSDEYATFNRDAGDAGVLLAGEALQPAETATVVRLKESGTAVTDGPFGNAGGVFAGFYLLDCENLDQAIEWASRIPAARDGAVEVRPVLEHR